MYGEMGDPDQAIQIHNNPWFDDYWNREIRRNVRIVKIDVEGAEMKVLEGMKNVLRARQCEYLIVEVSDDRLRSLGMSALSALDLLRSHGYKLFRIGMFRLIPILQDETVQYANILATLTTETVD